MSDTTEKLQLPDGRQLSYLRTGPVEGDPFFYFHGLPGSCYESLLIEQQAIALNLSIIAIDRPGYGLSDNCPDRTLLDWPKDVAFVADRLGIEKFGLIGVSGGGPYTLACAHAIANRLTSVGIICGLGPVFHKSLLNEMTFFTRMAFSLERSSPRLFRLLYGLPLQMLARTSPKLAVRIVAQNLGGLDRKVLMRTKVMNIIAQNLEQAFSQGIDAAIQDVHLYQQPWGFELSDITTEVHLWHGTADRIVPVSHSEFITNHLPRSKFTLVPDAGHFSLPVLHGEAILSQLKVHL